MPIFENSFVVKRQKKLAEFFEKSGSVVLVASGEPVAKPGGLDQTYPFLPHPEYYWLTGSRRSGGVMAFAPKEGWTHFVRKADAVERLWEGEPEVPEGESVLRLNEWIRAHSSFPNVVLGNPNHSPVSGVKSDPTQKKAIQEIMDRVRRHKDEAEIALMRQAVRATASAFRKAREVIHPGVTERHVQIEMEAEMLRAGATGTSFGTIVAAGTHASVIHFEPGARVIAKNDLVLLDSGAEVHEYAADVSRTVPAEERFTPEQQAIYDLVLAAQLAGISKCQPGTEWHEVHRTAASTIARGLVDLGILKGSIDELLDSEAIALFFPHGVGHMLGLRVRDVGGRHPDRPDGRMCCGARVRVDLPLETGFVMTVEPGVYFVPAILENPELRQKHKNRVSWDDLHRWREVGGVRIEDDVLISTDVPDVLTSEIPK